MFFSRQSNKKPLSDAELIDAYKASGNTELVGELYQRYSHLVYGLCLKHLKNEAESKDAVLNIFEKLMKDLKKHEIKHFKSWLYMVTKNHCLMFLRDLQKQTTKELEHMRDEQTKLYAVQPEQKEEKEEKIQNLEDAIEQLKPEQKECIKLFYIEEKCYKEVADITGYDMKKVKSYIQNGKRNLKIILSKEHESGVAR